MNPTSSDERNIEYEPIRIRLVLREPIPDSGNKRESFWKALRADNEENIEIPALEAQLCRELGIELRKHLVESLAASLRAVDDVFLNRREVRDFERSRRWQAYDDLARWADQRRQYLIDSPEMQAVRERLAAAASVVFAVRISSYSSLNLDLSVGSLNKLVDAFENDFESFRVFLEAFLPQAFADVFDSDEADRLQFDVHIPQSFSSAFRSQTHRAFKQAPPQAQPANQPPSQPSSARDRAEWLWRLANGSLLIPVLLSLLVMWQGVAMLRDIRSSQYDMMKPMLDHQLKLLEEDRRRLIQELPPTKPDSTSTRR